MEEIDIWRTATLLIRQHGDDAVFEAALRADGLLTKEAGILPARRRSRFRLRLRQNLSAAGRQLAMRI